VRNIAKNDCILSDTKDEGENERKVEENGVIFEVLMVVRIDSFPI
jgi:hypothetical protein